MHFLKDLQAANCEDGFALLEVKNNPKLSCTAAPPFANSTLYVFTPTEG